MDFADQIEALANRIPKIRDTLQTEEATKMALIAPFINALGYNVFDPTEVVPEFVADVGIKKGEKVDYAIMKAGEPAILIECKWSGMGLTDEHDSQLSRYFHVTKARIAILTNGVQYRFYTDLEEPNKMDPRPFLELDMLNLKKSVVNEVKRLAKPYFDVQAMVAAANELKYTREIKRVFAEQLENPDPELVKFFVSRVASVSRLTPALREQFTGFVRTALNQYLGDRLEARLQSAIDQEKAAVEAPPIQEVPAPEEKVVTTQEELDAFQIIKAIVAQTIDPKRVVMRDTQSYCGILIDDNNRKPLCRLRFGTAKKSIGIIEADKSEIREEINGLSDIYKFADRLRATAASYL